MGASYARQGFQSIANAQPRLPLEMISAAVAQRTDVEERQAGAGKRSGSISNDCVRNIVLNSPTGELSATSPRRRRKGAAA